MLYFTLAFIVILINVIAVYRYLIGTGAFGSVVASMLLFSALFLSVIGGFIHV